MAKQFVYKVTGPCLYDGCYREPGRHDRIVKDKKIDPIPKFLELVGDAPEKETSQEPVFASPVAKELAEESGIDPASIEGSGKDGKITVADVEAAIAATND